MSLVMMRLSGCMIQRKVCISNMLLTHKSVSSSLNLPPVYVFYAKIVQLYIHLSNGSSMYHIVISVRAIIYDDNPYSLWPFYFALLHLQR